MSNTTTIETCPDLGSVNSDATSDSFVPCSRESRRVFDRAWRRAGGTIEAVRRTGEARYRHDRLPHPVRVNDRRKDVPAKLLSAFAAVKRFIKQDAGVGTHLAYKHS